MRGCCPRRRKVVRRADTLELPAAPAAAAADVGDSGDDTDLDSSDFDPDEFISSSDAPKSEPASRSASSLVNVAPATARVGGGARAGTKASTTLGQLDSGATHMAAGNAPNTSGSTVATAGGRRRAVRPAVARRGTHRGVVGGGGGGGGSGGQPPKRRLPAWMKQ